MSQEIFKKIGLRSLLYATLFFSPCAFSELSEIYSFTSFEQKIQFEAIIQEMRCLVCQNQSLADSNAPLANDLRLAIYQRVRAGESTEQIKNYLISRYGEFISLKPLFSHRNIYLWLFPFIVLIIIVFLIICKIKWDLT